MKIKFDRVKSGMNSALHSTRQAFTLIEVMIVMAIIALLAACLMPAMFKAKAQPAPGTTVFQPNFWTAISNYIGLSVTSNSTVVAFNPAPNQTITIRQNQGDAYLFSITVTNSPTGNFVLGLDVNDTGATNHWTTNNTSHFLSYTNALPTGGTPTAPVTAIFAINIDKALLNNFRQVFPTACYSSAAFGTITVNWLDETHGNQ